MSYKSYLMIAAATLVVTGFAGHGARAENGDSELAAFRAAKISLYEAVGLAETKLPGKKIISAEFEMEDGKPAYTMEAADAQGTHEVTLDAETGELIGEAKGEVVPSPE